MEGSKQYNYLISAIQGGISKSVKELISFFTFSKAEQYSSFCLAVFYNQTSIVKFLLQHKFVFFDQYTNKCPVIQIAEHNNNIEIIEALLEQGINIDFSLEASVLFLATCTGNEKVLKLLVFKGVNIHQMVRGPFSCIHVAVEKAHLNIIEFLLTNGADVNAKYPVEGEVNTGSSILHHAAEKGNTAIIQLLVKYGTDVNIKNGNGVTALHIAVERGFIQIAKLLIQNGACISSRIASVIERGYYQEKFHENRTLKFYLGVKSPLATNVSVYEGACTPLHIAVKCNQGKLVKLLLENGSNVNVEDSYGNTALLLAVKIGCPMMVEHILDHQPDKQNESNRCALHLAAKFCSKESKKIVQDLLSYGFSCGSRHLINYDLLFHAVRNNHIKIVQQILDECANVNELNIVEDHLFHELSGETLLCTAVKNGDEGLVRLLVEHGADINSKSECGRFPISCAVDCSNLEVAKILLAKGAKVENDPEILLIAVQKGCLELVRILLNHGANVKKVVVPEYISPRPSQYVPLMNKKEEAISLFCFGVTALFIAAQEGFEKIVNILLEYGANKNIRLMNDMTPLLISVVGGHFKVVELLIKSGSNIHSMDSDGRTALYLAAQFGHVNVLKLLLKHGANVDCRSKHKTTALLVAIAGGYLEVVNTLIKYGASLDAGLMLCTAAYGGHLDLLKYLLKLPKSIVELDHRNSEGHTPLFVSASAGYSETVEILLIHGANVNSADVDGRTALHSAAIKGHHVVLKLLLKHGAQVDFKNKKNETALFLAAEKGHDEIVRTLIEFGAHIDSSDHRGRTPLIVATKQGHDEVVSLLLAQGAEYDLEVEEFRLPLLAFAKRGNLNITEVLLKRGTNTELTDSIGKTALHLASEHNHVSVAKLLLKHGAKVNIEDRNGKTPLMISAKRGHLKTVRTLLKYGASIESRDHFHRTTLYSAAEYNRINVVKHLLKIGANVDSRAENGKTPLIISAERGNFEIVKILLDAGANSNSVDCEGFTALHFATEYGYIDALKLLLKYGAKVNSKTVIGRTPLFISAGMGRPKAAELLLKSGANVNAVDKNGLTALNFAAEYGHDKVVLSLIKYGAKIDCKTTGDIPLVVIAAERGHLQTVLMLLRSGAKINLVHNPHLVTYLVATIHSWKSQVFQAVLEYGSSDSKVLSESNIRPFFDILNKCARDRLYRSGVPQILVYHTVKMKAAGIYVGEENLVATAFCDETLIKDFKAKCVAEIEMMKNEIVEDSFISFNDILTKNLNGLAIFLKHPRVDEILRSDSYKLRFPIYSSFLSYQLQKGKQRRELVTYGIQICSFFFYYLPSLPYDLMEEIVFYLNDQELRRLLSEFRHVIVSGSKDCIKDQTLTHNNTLKESNYFSCSKFLL